MGVFPFTVAYDVVALWYAYDTDVLRRSIFGQPSVLFHYKGRQSELGLGTALLHYTGSVNLYSGFLFELGDCFDPTH